MVSWRLVKLAWNWANLFCITFLYMCLLKKKNKTMLCFCLLINRENLPALSASSPLVLIMKAFIILTVLLCILSQFVSIAFITFVVAVDQHHNNSCLQFLSENTSPDTWTSWIYWHISACPMPSFRKVKVIMDTLPQLCEPTEGQFHVCQPFGQPSRLTAWENPLQNKQQREDIDVS